MPQPSRGRLAPCRGRRGCSRRPGASTVELGREEDRRAFEDLVGPSQLAVIPLQPAQPLTLVDCQTGPVPGSLCCAAAAPVSRSNSEGGLYEGDVASANRAAVSDRCKKGHCSSVCRRVPRQLKHRDGRQGHPVAFGWPASGGHLSTRLVLKRPLSDRTVAYAC